MSVYKSDNPSDLIRAIDSVLNQSIKTNNFVIVADGPLTLELTEILNKKNSEEDFITIVKLIKNEGLGNALNYGLSFCENELVMRMDADDFSVPERAEKQLKYFQEHRAITVLGSQVGEFSNNIQEIERIRRVPNTHNEILKLLKFRNPLNHPSVMFKKDPILNIGGYTEIKGNEDYFLWVRLAQSGAIFANLEDCLLNMQINQDSYLRRRGLKYFKSQKIIYEYMKNKEMINTMEYNLNILIRFMTKVLFPPILMTIIYKKVLRK